MIKVLFVQGGAELAGAERILLALLRHLDRDRVRPVVAFLADGPVVADVEAAGVEVIRLPAAGRLRDVPRLPGTVRDLRTAIDGTGADVVQATGEKMAVYTGWAARAAGVPAVFWLHDAPGGGGAASLTQAAMTLTPRASVVTCAEWLATAFTDRRLPATAIQNGIELDLLPDPATCGRARGRLVDEHGWSASSVLVVHAARLQRWKGTEVFLRAAARVAARQPDVRFAVVGGALFGREERYAAGLPLLAAELGLGDRVAFTGHRRDALELLGGADIVAHCAIRPDPFPTVVLEATAMGVAVVASRAGGAVEQIVHGRTGVLTDPGDEQALAAELVRLAGDADERRRLGHAARADAARRWQARRMAAAFEDHWESVARGRVAS